MRTISTFIALLLIINASAQPEFSSGFAVNRQDAMGFPIQLGYDFHLSGRWYTKSQVGYKYMHRFNDFVGATLNVSTWEIHQTFSYEVIKKKKYILKPNIGVNYKFYHWEGKIEPPYNTLPERAWTIGLREGYFIIRNYDPYTTKEYSVNNFGFSIQIQNQFRLTDKVWLHLTPFIEPDYDRSQNIGGLYAGVILKSL